MKECEICNIIFQNSKTYSNHIRWQHTNIEYKRTKCAICNKQIRNENFEKHKTVCVSKNCKLCGKTIIGRKVFCDNSCSAKFNNNQRIYTHDYITEDWKQKQREATISNWNKGVYQNISKNKIFTSKKEREIVNYFKEKFPADNWKSGGRLKIGQDTYISRDLWSDDLRVCFEYDGIWHFKDIHNQLAVKQNKDILLENWCKDNNYRLVRIDEDVYKNVDQVEFLIYHQTDNIIKIGHRYQTSPPPF